MIKRSLIGLTAVIALMLAGCGAQPGKTVVSYSRGKSPPPLMEAPADGNYALYASNGMNPLYTAQLKKGDEFGFVKHGEGKEAKVVGVANDKEIPLEATFATGYYWKQQKP